MAVVGSDPSAPAHAAVLAWEAGFVADAVAATARGPYLPNDLVAALDAAALPTVEAFLTALRRGPAKTSPPTNCGPGGNG
jgi:hypothetical protein